MKHLFTIALASFAFFSCTQAVKNDKRTLIEILESYQKCKSNAADKTECKHFTAKAICEYNGIDDFMINGAYVDYHSIYEILQNNDAWEKLGNATDLEVLAKAQAFANETQPVVAVNTKDKNHYSVLIVEGQPKASNKWGGEVPVAASFFPVSSNMEPFIDKGLNYVWSSPEGIEIYIRR